MNSTTITILLALCTGVLAWQALPARTAGQVAYPQGYRDWTHVKSALMNPQHASFAESGGFHHLYANAEAMLGYRTGAFPQGSIIVFDWLQMTHSEGMFLEGPRRRIDVMVKDSQRFAATGGWGFERFAADSQTELAAAPPRDQCFACHLRLKKNDLVLSSYRP